MAKAIDLDQPLPVLRPDIEFHLGPDEADGSPGYIVHDPLAGTFDKANWVQAVVLRQLRVPLTLRQLLEQLETQTTLRVTADEVLMLCEDAARRGLIRPGSGSDQSQTAEPRWRPSSFSDVWMRVFRTLIYVRIPLLRPDAFLERTAAYVRPLAHPVMLTAYAVVLVAGLLLLGQRFDAYLATFPYFFTWRGMAAYTAAVVVVKVVHEFSHAFVAKGLGNRVSSMGIALIYLFPVGYTDVTDSWRMRSRSKRVLIALAGVMAEVVIAGVTLIIWSLSPRGVVSSVCFVLSSTSLVSTLLVNLNPAMRFDGYYVLCDVLGIDNLQSRSYAMLRWLIRRHVVGMDLPSPESGASGRRQFMMGAYACLAWLYRLSIYIGISLMLYHWVAKVVGVVLFATALVSLLVQPVIRELRALARLRRHIRRRPRFVMSAAALAALVLWLALPLPRREAIPAITCADATQVVYTPTRGRLEEIRVEQGRQVHEGDVLCIVRSQEREAEAEMARLELERIDIELAIIQEDPAQRSSYREKLEERARAEADLKRVLAEIEAGRIVAETDGILVAWDEGLREGTPVRADQVLGLVVHGGRPEVGAYVPERLAAELDRGQEVTFFADARSSGLRGRVTFMESTRTDVLAHRGLGSVAGGPIAVRPDDADRFNVVDTYYRVSIALQNPPSDLRTGQTGSVWLRTGPRSKVLQWLWSGWRVVLRESGF